MYPTPPTIKQIVSDATDLACGQYCTCHCNQVIDNRPKQASVVLTADQIAAVDDTAGLAS